MIIWDGGLSTSYDIIYLYIFNIILTLLQVACILIGWVEPIRHGLHGQTWQKTAGTQVWLGAVAVSARSSGVFASENGGDTMGTPSPLKRILEWLLPSGNLT